MALFDLFGKEPKTKNERTRNIFEPENENIHNGNSASPFQVIYPKSYDDVSVIIDALKEGYQVVVHLTELKPETAVRILDMLSGAIYALDGSFYEVQKNIFMFSKSSIEVK